MLARVAIARKKNFEAWRGGANRQQLPSQAACGTDLFTQLRLRRPVIRRGLAR